MDVISNMNLLNIEVINVFYQKRYCFTKCINFKRGEDYKEQYLELIRNEKRRSITMTKARIQPLCRANNNNLGYFDGEKNFPQIDYR